MGAEVPAREEARAVANQEGTGHEAQAQQDAAGEVNQSVAEGAGRGGVLVAVVDWAAGGGVDQAGVRRVISCELFARLAAVIGDDGAATEIATVRAEREGHRPLGQSSLASD